MGELIGMMIKKALKGEDPTKVPLPVRIFEPTSLLQRISRWYTQAPLLLNTESADPLVNFRGVIAFAISSLFHTVN